MRQRRQDGSARGWRAALLNGLAGGIGCVALAGWPVAPLHAQAPIAATATPQAVAVAQDQDLLSQPQLEQLLAPVALFPDPLLMQALMAATYPLEIVQAERWLRQDRNAALQGDALAQALEAQPWDPSVKSLVPFPDLLKMMSEQLDWTQQLGDAVLGQQEDVLNTVQVLRGRAVSAGHLQSGPQQTVTVNNNVTFEAPPPGVTRVVAPPPQVIVIQPAQPQTVFVPVYNPNVVFGTWPHAGYPPTWFPPPPGWGLANALLTGMAFAGGVALVGSLWGWATPSWGRGSVNVNVNRFNSINVNRTQITNNVWRHDVTHRQGVAYRNQQVQNRFRGDPAAARQAAQNRDQFRGRLQEVERGGNLADRRPGDGSGLGNRTPGGDRPAIGDRLPGGTGERPNLGDRRPGDGTGPGARLPAGDRPNLAERVPGGATARPMPADRAPGGAAQRPALADRVGERPAPATRPNIGQAPSGRPQIQPQQRPAPDRGAPAFQGSGNAAAARAAAERGAASRQAPPSRAAVQQAGGARAAAQQAGGARAAAQQAGGARAAAANRAGARQR